MKQKSRFCSKCKFLILSILFQLQVPFISFSQSIQELNSGWLCKPISDMLLSGEEITGSSDFDSSGWLPATVPGTVLTTLLNNNKIPDPFFGMNNEEIPDVYDTGRDHYTYWFYKEFDVESPKKDAFWLIFRGVNYSCDIYLNGKKINRETHFGMFLRQKYHVTAQIKKGNNKLAVIVYPPDSVGNANGGQGGDGEIAKNVMHQYVAGWDWIQPVRDRNTGIWDKVLLENTGPVDIRNTHVVTQVSGKRFPGEKQKPAQIIVTTELVNSGNKSTEGELNIRVDGKEIKKKLLLQSNSSVTTEKSEILIENPKLWWPSGYGDQALYDLEIQFKMGKSVSDHQKVRVGIREINTEWNQKTMSRQIYVNGQKIFIKGGNWIISDAMLRFSKERYNAEIRMHRDMNLNTIRIWGGAITERPEFYEACDKYGMLVMQDFWISGDCNGRWLDPRKKEDQWTRRKYPDDHNLFLTSAADQIKMIRNHPSLAFWCGGNELGPAESVLNPLKDSLKLLDGTRWFVDYSTSDSMSFNTLGGNGDGPYGIQNITTFFEHKTFPFNSEVGSVGLPDYEGLKRYLPDSALVIPGKYQPKENVDNRRWTGIHPAWRYHKILPYRDFISKYGEPNSVEEYAFQAQLVNYNQYRGLIEGFSSHMWEWYTGVMIWKTQNPWTSMRGQMYDYYLDQNAGLYGLRHGSESLHIFLNPETNHVMIANNTFKTQNDLMIQVNALDMAGKKTVAYQEIVTIIPAASKQYGSLNRRLTGMQKKEGVFLQMKLFDSDQTLISENFYWLPDENGEYPGLQTLKNIRLKASAHQKDKHLVLVKLNNSSSTGPVSFFNRISVIDKKTDLRALPVFYSDNYISILPGEEKTVAIDIGSLKDKSDLMIRIQGWNVVDFDVEIKGK